MRCYTYETIIATGLVASDVYLSLHSIEVIYFATTNAQQIKQISRLAPHSFQVMASLTICEGDFLGGNVLHLTPEILKPLNLAESMKPSQEYCRYLLGEVKICPERDWGSIGEDQPQ